MKRFIKIIGLALVLLGTTAACEKENRPTSATMAVRIQDYPGTRTPYEAVNIDVKQVQVFYESGTWVNLTTNAGLFNLIELRQGRSAFLARKQTVATGTISQIKIIPGSRSTIKTNGRTYPLFIESHDMAGMVIPARIRLAADETADVLIGMDGHLSVAVDGEGLYRLKPSMQVISSVVTTPGGVPK